MKKFLLSCALASLTLGAYADQVYNFFDPEDCDEAGWLWLDTQEKIDKYVGKDKKIKLVQAMYEEEDPEFPGEYFTPECSVSPDFEGYNQLGEAGGEGSVTGGIFLPPASYDPEEDYFATDGGGFLIEMPDCALFEVYASQPFPELKFEFYAAKAETDDYTACDYLWDDDPYYDWSTEQMEGGPVITQYAGPYLNIQEIVLDYEMGEGSEDDTLSIYGAKGQPRTAYIANYTYTKGELNSTCPIYVHGFHILTYTSVSSDETAVGIVAAENAAPVYFNLQGIKVANPDHGIFIVKEGNKTRKVVL